MIFEWPTPLLAPRIADLFLTENTRSAGESITGFEQVAEGITQRWSLRLDFNTLKRDAILPYRALMASLRGRANLVRVPIRDAWLWPADGLIGITNVPARDDPWRLLADGTEVEDVAATVTGTAGERTVEVDFASLLDDPAGIVFPGMYFGAGNDLHMIALEGLEWAGTVATITFEPALRQDHAAAAFKFRPSLLCRKVTDETGRHPTEHHRRMSPSLELVEVLPDELSLLEAEA